MITILTKSYSPPPICEKEILRYAGCKSVDNETLKLLKTCIDETQDIIKYKVCYCVLPVKTCDKTCDFFHFKILSGQLAKRLSGCKSVLLFGATLGIELDRLIAKYGKTSPAKALVIQALGAERIEALCDTFCNEFCAENKVSLRPRFSPGYADLSLEYQKDIFKILDCPRKIGLSLNESLLMSPSKSVTAFAGITENKVKQINKCNLCDYTDCTFRSTL